MKINKMNISELSVLIADTLAIVASYWISVMIRFEFDSVDAFPYVQLLFKMLPALIIIHLIIMYLFKVNLSLWRYISVEESVRVVSSIFVTTVLFYYFGFYVHGLLPRSIYLLGTILTIGTMLGIRVIYRYLRLQTLSKDKHLTCLIIGAGDAGYILSKEIVSNQKLNYRVVGFVDDDLYKCNKLVNGIRVLGTTDDLAMIKKKQRIDIAFIAIPSAPQELIKRIYDKCSENDLNVKILAITEKEKVDTNALRDIRIEDLLNRKPITLENDSISSYIKDKVILVTGAGGSIGSELVRQIIQFHPKQCCLFDIYENNMYSLQQEIAMKKKSGIIPQDIEIVCLIGSVRDRNRISQVIKKFKPSIVFHAAAHKHVPLMENSPKEAIKNNVFGTYNVLAESINNGVDKFILVSTDKAVNPTNVMGATKRLCEMIVQGYRGNGVTKLGAVRFGNVLGSNGSVIPLFMDQIKSGGPVTVTHPDIERFFMTIPEASQLILQAGAFATHGDIYILDMGVPVKIAKLAEDLIRLAGFKPNVDIEIRYTGLREGEKMYEELYLENEERTKTPNDLIYVIEPLLINQEEMDAILEQLYNIVNSSMSDEEVKKEILALIQV